VEAAQVADARAWDDEAKTQLKVARDVEKIDRQLAAGACRLGYVIVFEECDWGFEADYAAQAAAAHGCRVRFIRGYDARS
jgi:hypothetical protein